MNRQEIAKKVVKILTDQINQQGYTTVEESLIEIGWLKPVDLQRWYKGQVPYLEKVCQTNLFF